MTDTTNVIVPVAAFQTKDGKLFLTQEEADAHKVHLTQKEIRKKRHKIIWTHLHNSVNSNAIERMLDKFDLIRDDMEDENVMNPD